jgi:hypothetical protein
LASLGIEEVEGLREELQRLREEVAGLKAESDGFLYGAKAIGTSSDALPNMSTRNARPVT